MEQQYNPLEHSVVQGVLTADRTCQFEATAFHQALLFAIAREIGRVHWNVYQKNWDRWSDNPNIPGIHWRRYRYDCACPDANNDFLPAHHEDCIATTPHFQFEQIQFDWYKNPGRGMSMNVTLSSEEWVHWFDRCLAKIQAFDTEANRQLFKDR